MHMSVNSVIKYSGGLNFKKLEQNPTNDLKEVICINKHFVERHGH